jgi:hypothetical protein
MIVPLFSSDFRGRADGLRWRFTESGCRRSNGTDMAAAEMKPPIILIGNYRSGTTITQNLIGLHPDIVTWYEPRTMWRYADPGRRHDEYSDADATERVIRYLRRRFLEYQTRHGNRQVMENTPSNVLRVPFVYKVFPEAVYLYITRNPFSSISSIELKWHKPKTWSGLKRNLSDTPWMQLPYYAGDFFSHMIIRRLSKEEYIPFYGPRYQGLDEDLRRHGKLRIIARQWARCNRKARDDLSRLGADRVLTFRYEDLMEDTDGVLRRIYAHCGLACDDGIVRAARQMVDPGRQQKWHRLDPGDLRAIVSEIEEEMAVYGYEVPAVLQ